MADYTVMPSPKPHPNGVITVDASTVPDLTSMPQTIPIRVPRPLVRSECLSGASATDMASPTRSGFLNETTTNVAFLAPSETETWRNSNDQIRFSSQSRSDEFKWNALVNGETSSEMKSLIYMPTWLKHMHYQFSGRFPESVFPMLTFSVSAIWILYTTVLFAVLNAQPTLWICFPALAGLFLTLLGCAISWRQYTDSVATWTLRSTLVIIPITYHLLFGFANSGGIIFIAPMVNCFSGVFYRDTAHVPGVRTISFCGIIAAIVIEPILNLHELFSPLPAALSNIVLLMTIAFVMATLFLTGSIWIYDNLLSRPGASSSPYGVTSTSPMPSTQRPKVAAPQALAVLNKDGLILACNNQFSDLFGFSMSHRNLFDFLKDKTGRIREYVEEAHPLRSSASLLDVYEIIQKSGAGGSLRLLVFRTFCHLPGVFVADVSDVTDGIGSGVDRLMVKLLGEGLMDGIVTTNADMEIQAFNEAALDLFEFSEPEQLMGKKIDQLAAKICDDKLERAATSESVAFRRRSVAAMGVSYILHECRALSGHPTFLAYLRKVTFNPVAQPSDESNKGERMLDGILSTMANSVIMADETSTIIRVNAAALRMFGYEEPELKGKCISIVMPDGFAARHQKAVTDYMATGRGTVMGHCGIQAQARHKDGTTIAVSLGLSGCIFPDGSRIFTAIFHDARPELEAQQAALTKKAADACLETQQQFTQYLFHVLRNPLNSAAKGVELVSLALNNHRLTAEDRCTNALTEIHHITESMSHTLHIMDNLLDIYNLQSGKEFLAHVPFSLADQFRHISECLRHLMKEGVELRVSPVVLGDDVQLLGSPYHFQQVLANLLMNASQWTKQGSIQLNALLVNQTDKDVTVQIQVADTGCGMNREQRAIILRHKDSVTLRIGTGLGLTIVQNLVKLMGGSLQINSPWRPGLQIPRVTELESDAHRAEEIQGCNFFFTLTFKKAAVADAAEKDPLPPNLSVLVVDDLALNRRLWRIIFTSGPFKDLKWKIDDVEDGETAIQKIIEDGKTYSIIILDEFLGDNKKRGREVARELRQWEESHELTPMLMIGASGNCTNEDREAALAAGQDLFYGKPYPTAPQVERDIAPIIRERYVRQEQQFCLRVDDLSVVASGADPLATALSGIGVGVGTSSGVPILPCVSSHSYQDLGPSLEMLAAYEGGVKGVFPTPTSNSDLAQQMPPAPSSSIESQATNRMLLPPLTAGQKRRSLIMTADGKSPRVVRRAGFLAPKAAARIMQTARSVGSTSTARSTRAAALLGNLLPPSTARSQKQQDNQLAVFSDLPA